MSGTKVLFVHEFPLSLVAGTTVVLADLVGLIPTVDPGRTVGYQWFDGSVRPGDVGRSLSANHSDADSVIAVNLHVERAWEHALRVFDWCLGHTKPGYLYVHDYWPHHREPVQFLVDEYGARILASTGYVRDSLGRDGIDATLVQVGLSRRHLRFPAAGAPGGKKVVASSGRIVPRKRFPDIVRAFGAAAAGSDARLHLRLLPSLVFSPDEDERRLQELQVLAEAHRVDGAGVEMIRRPRRRHGYGPFSVYVCASYYEGFSMPPIESAYSGCPPLMSDIPPHRAIARQLFGDRCEDFLYPTGDHQALAALLGDELRTGDRMEFVRESLPAIRAAVDTNLSLASTARTLLAVIDAADPTLRTGAPDALATQP